MKIEQCRWLPVSGWEDGVEPKILGDKANLVLFFTTQDILLNNPVIGELKKFYPNAEVVGCSGYDQIYKQKVFDESLVVVAFHFESSMVKVVSSTVDDISKSEQLGIEAVKQLELEGLKHVIAFNGGDCVAGTPLVKGISSQLPDNIGLTGGFTQNEIYHNKVLPYGSVVVIGLYGDYLKVGYSAHAGWKSYGMIRQITKSSGQILQELDGKPVLDLYKQFLGPFAKELPGIGLLYPMSIWENKDNPQEAFARTITHVYEEDKSIRFAGDVPEGYFSQFMLTNNEMLISGAIQASEGALQTMQDAKPQFALLVTCITRKLVMKQRIEEEIEAVGDILGKNTVAVGFYSTGEISPIKLMGKCHFQNQVMAITTIQEDVPE